MNNYKRHFFVLLSSTFVAQLIGILSSPILTRIYSVDEYGYYGMYLSSIAILGTIATLRYEFSLNIENNKKNIVAINKLIRYCSFSLLLLICLVFMIIIFFNDIEKEIRYLFLFIGIGSMLTGILQSSKYILNREKQFNTLSKLAITQVMISTVTAVILSFSTFKNYGLIISNIIALATIVYFQNNTKYVKNIVNTKIRFKRILFVMKKYDSFPKYNLPSTIFDQISIQMPIFVLGYFFSAGTVGLYSLTSRTLLLPLNIVGGTISQVYLSKISDNFRKKKSFRDVTYKLLIILALIGIFSFGTLYFISEDLFSLIFGKEWAMSGYFASLLSIGLFFRFITNPLSSVLLITQEVKKLSYLQGIRLVSTSLTLIVSSTIFKVEKVLFFYSIHEAIYYICYLYLIIRVVNSHHRRNR